MSDAPELRIGILGAARIVKQALLVPAASTRGVAVAAVAARSQQRARQYARRHGIPRALGSYDAILADPDIDAVYIPLPAALHGLWMTRAVAAGKHVLCEKPFTANAAEAADIVRIADASPVVVMEAFHSRHHPLWKRIRDLLDSDILGNVRHARASFCVPLFPGKDIRWQQELGGGALMDVGVYPIALLRYLFGEPVVVEAQARDRNGVDAWANVKLDLGSGIEGEVAASMWSRTLFQSRLDIQGSKGSLRVSWPYHPQAGAAVTVNSAGRSKERASRESSFWFQLAAFREAVNGTGPVITDARHALGTMRVVDAAYRAAGMEPRAKKQGI